MTDITDRTRTYIIDNFLFGQGGDLDEETSFLKKGVLDSTGVLELVTFVEKTFGIAVQDDDLVPENLDSLKAIDAFVRGKLAAQSASPSPAGTSR